MGFEAAAFTIGGGWDIFDRACGVVDYIEHMIREDEEENGETPIQYHRGKKNEDLGLETKDHLFDPTQDKFNRLETARKQIQDACLACQEVMDEL